MAPLSATGASDPAAHIGIVIPVYDRWPQTQRCLYSLAASQCQDFTVYVVDHGLTDATQKGLEGFPDVIRVAGNPSWWWSAATNAGTRRAREDGLAWIMWLNGDCLVRPDTLGTIRERSLRWPRAIVAPVQVSLRTNRKEAWGIRTGLTLGFPTLRDPWPQARPAPATRAVRLIMGGRGAVIPAAIFDDIGYLDAEHLPHYAADHDFYLRARRAGYALLVAEDAYVDVDESTTSQASDLWALSAAQWLATLWDRRSHRNLRDLTAFFKKHYPVPGLWPVGVALNLVRYLGLYVIRRVLGSATGRGRRA